MANIQITLDDEIYNIPIDDYPYLAQGATFKPYTLQLADNKIEIGYTNDFGLENPEPVTLEFPQLSDADRTSYNGQLYDTIGERIDADIQDLLNKIDNKIDLVAYEGTSIHANNTYARNLVANRSKVEVLGQTIQNCLDHSSADKFSTLNGTVDEDGYITLNGEGDWVSAYTKVSSAVLKPSTTYTFIVDVKSNSAVTTGSLIKFADESQTAPSMFKASKILNELPVGITKFTMTTIDDLSLAKYADRATLYPNVTSGTIKFRYAIVEGDWTNKEISFVPFGLNYPATTEVVGCGKNLFDVSKIPTTWNGTTGIKNNGDGTIYLKNTPGDSAVATKMKLKDLCPWLKDGKKYLLSYENSTYQDAKQFYLSEIRKYWLVGIPLQMTSEHLESFVYMYPSERPNTEATLSNLQIEEAEVATDYEPYTERKVNINKPLASINDTIRDKYYVKDGKKYHEQVVKEIVFDGSDDEVWSFDSDNNYYHIKVSDLKHYSKLLCDKAYYMDGRPDKFGQCYATSVIVLGCDRSVYPTSQDFKNYLKTNPYKVLYELATPITTEIETENWYSFNEQTNITTTNVVKPTLDIDIPSDLNAVVSNLMVENATLQAENQALTSELESQATSIETQQANVDYISMMTGVDL